MKQLHPPAPPYSAMFSSSSKSTLSSQSTSEVLDAPMKPKQNNPAFESNANSFWWDVAHVTSRHYEQEQTINKERRLTFRRIVKIIVYIIFFLVVLTSAVASKLSLFTMINAYKTLEQVHCYRFVIDRFHSFFLL